MSASGTSSRGAALAALVTACALGGGVARGEGGAQRRGAGRATSVSASTSPTVSTPSASVTVAAGCVTVGPAEPYHVLVPRQVCLPAFRLDRAEVSVAEYQRCVAAGVCAPAPADNALCNANRDGRGGHPANCVAYEDAVRYCRWRGARLPSPDEWERAARGPAMTTYPWGEAAPAPALVAFPRLAGHDHETTTSPVCSHPRGNSAEGACDLAGNVAEWVAGYWGDSGLLPTAEPAAAAGAAGAPGAAGGAGVAGTAGGLRMTRGGSFGEGKDSLLGWMRQSVAATAPPSIRNGFRCAAEL